MPGATGASLPDTIAVSPFEAAAAMGVVAEGIAAWVGRGTTLTFKAGRGSAADKVAVAPDDDAVVDTRDAPLLLTPVGRETLLLLAATLCWPLPLCKTGRIPMGPGPLTRALLLLVPVLLTAAAAAALLAIPCSVARAVSSTADTPLSTCSSSDSSSFSPSRPPVRRRLLFNNGLARSELTTPTPDRDALRFLGASVPNLGMVLQN
jgi:hypothetical protein